MKTLYLLLIISLLPNSVPLLGSDFLSSDDDNYLYLSRDRYQYIFPKEYQYLIPNIIEKNEYLRDIYEEEFHWKLDEIIPLTIASSKNQIANAFITPQPYPQAVFYGGGANAIDLFAEKSWLIGLLAHETTHLYQINTKREFSQFFHTIFGNHPIFLQMISPNLILPMWLLEGNATFNESRFGNGGRLYSGEQRALFYTLLDQGITENNIINMTLNFPYGHEKYIIGAYFNLFLSQKYGIKKNNSLFFAHALHWLNPLILDTTFKHHFGKGYYSLLHSFLDKYELKANRQNRSERPAIAKSIHYTYMNRDQGHIYVLTGDGKEYPKLLDFDIKSKTYTQQSIDIPIGKIFKINNQYYSVYSDNIDGEGTKYSLWNKHGHLPDYTSKIMLDIKGDNQLYFHAPSSFDEPNLFKNDKFETVCNSSALLDSAGNYYYFQQNYKTRTLYKNKEKLLSFEGYYGKVVDIDNDSVYFIASSEFGSSLFEFEYQNQKTYRISNLDTIFDAKKIEEGEFLINEITSTGYHYKTIYTEREEELPFTYQYFFEGYTPFINLNHISSESDVFDLNIAPEIFEYNSLTQMRLSYWNFLYLSNNHTTIFNIGSFWTDPLGNNQITTNITKEDDLYDTNETKLNLVYTNSQFKINYGFKYEHSFIHKDYYTLEENKNDNNYSIFTNYQLFSKNNFTSTTQIQYEYDTEDYNIYTFKINWNYLKRFNLSTISYRNIYLKNKTSYFDRYERTVITTNGHLI